MCRQKEFHLLKILEQEAKAFQYILLALPQNRTSLVKYEITTDEKEKQMNISSDKVTLAIDFTDDTVVQCICGAPVVENTSADDGDI